VDDEGTHLSRKDALACVYGKSLPEGRYEDLLGKLESLAQGAARKAGFKAITQGSLNNCRGFWFEMMVSATLWNTALRLRAATDLVVVRLPSADAGERVNLIAFYSPDIQRKLRVAEIFSSNPDFICASGLKWSALPALFSHGVQALSRRDIDTLEGAYRNLLQKCDRRSIRACIAIKTSTRPDRRYQIMHEANFFKALSVQLRKNKRVVGTEPTFLVITTVHHEQDEKILRAPSFSSVALGKPSPAVNEIYTVETTDQMSKVAESIIGNLVASVR
jgi:hypothetical protein